MDRPKRISTPQGAVGWVTFDASTPERAASFVELLDIIDDAQAGAWRSETWRERVRKLFNHLDGASVMAAYSALAVYDSVEMVERLIFIRDVIYVPVMSVVFTDSGFTKLREPVSWYIDRTAPTGAVRLPNERSLWDKGFRDDLRKLLATSPV